jgi:uncharacterized protein (TIGR00645 family)
MRIKNSVESFIFSSRWLLIPFYVGLFAAMLIYMFVYVKEIIHLIREVGILNKDAIMLSILEIVDIVMIANLVKMIITGSYNSFVDKEHGVSGETVSSGGLKVKMATSMMGVSAIHLLQSFIDAKNVEEDELRKQLWIHGIFIIGSLVLAIIDFLHLKSESFNHHGPKKAAGGDEL